MTPKLLSNAVFALYGGQTGTASDALLQVAYELAEELVEEYLGTPLVETQITGSFPPDPLHRYYALPHTRIKSLDRIYAVELTGSHEEIFDLGSTVFLADPMRGVLDKYGLMGLPSVGYEVRVVYTAGFDSGTTQLLWPLTMTAQYVLNELVEPDSQETVGVRQWTNMRYSETREKLYMGILGTSAKSNFITVLLNRLKVKRVGRL